MKKSGLLSFVFCAVFVVAAHAELGHLYTDGEEIVKDAILACESIREKGNPDLPLPKVFRSYLRKSLVAARRALPKNESESLERDAKVLLDHPNLFTLFQWNVFHLRLVGFFEYFNNTLVDSLGISGRSAMQEDVAILSSQEATLAELTKAHKYRGDGFKSIFRWIGVDALRVSKDFNYCPVSVYGSLGLNPLSLAFSQQVYPLGIVSKPVLYDGGFVEGPVGFFDHDIGHTVYAERYADVLDKATRISSQRKVLSDFSRFTALLPESVQRKVAKIYFMMIHEQFPDDSPYLSRIEHACREKDNFGMFASNFNLSVATEMLAFDFRENPKSFNCGKFPTTKDWCDALKSVLEIHSIFDQNPNSYRLRLGDLDSFQRTAVRETIYQFKEYLGTFCDSWNIFKMLPTGKVSFDIKRRMGAMRVTIDKIGAQNRSIEFEGVGKIKFYNEDVPKVLSLLSQSGAHDRIQGFPENEGPVSCGIYSCTKLKFMNGDTVTVYTSDVERFSSLFQEAGNLTD